MQCHTAISDGVLFSAGYLGKASQKRWLFSEDLIKSFASYLNSWGRKASTNTLGWGVLVRWVSGNVTVNGWHHRLSGHGFGWTLGVGDGQGGLACCASWGRKESDMTEQLNWTELSREEFNLGLETRLDCSELLCNKVLLNYKRDRESFWDRHHKGAERVPRH